MLRGDREIERDKKTRLEHSTERVLQVGSYKVVLLIKHNQILPVTRNTRPPPSRKPSLSHPLYYQLVLSMHVSLFHVPPLVEGGAEGGEGHPDIAQLGAVRAADVPQRVVLVLRNVD